MNRLLPHYNRLNLENCRNLFILALIFLFSTSARASCNASWTYSIHGDTVFLQSADTASTNHHYWSFNGVFNTSNQTTLYHVYPNNGTYRICQYVYTTGGGCADSLCQYITIQANSTPCNLNTAWTYTTHGDTVYVTASDTNSANHHYWTFGSYTSTSNSLTASYAFAQPGTYRVCLHEYTPQTNCVDSFCQYVTVQATTTCNISAAWQSLTHGDTVTFYPVVNSNTSTHYYWNFGDGSAYGTGTQPTHVYATAGTYHVCLYEYIPNTNCSDSFCHDVTVTTVPCHVSAAWTYTIHGDTVFLHSTDTSSANNHYWTFGTTTYASGVSVYHVFPNYGVNRICLHVYTPGTTCSDSSCSTITLPYPCHISAAWIYSASGSVIHFYAADSSTNVQRVWTFGDGGTASGTNPVHTYTTPGTYHVCLRSYGVGTACVDSFCSTIVVGTVCNITAAWQSGVHGDTARFYATSNSGTVAYSWNFGDGHTGTGIYPTHVYAQPGTYHVCLYVAVNNANCIDSFCNTVTIAGGCHVSAAWSYTISGDTVFLHSTDTSSVNHHYWSFNGVYNTSNQTSFYHVFSAPGTYRICQYVYTPGTACIDSSCNTVTITNPCNVHAGWQYYTTGDTAHFFSGSNTGTVYYNWHFGDGTSGTGSTPLHVYTQPGTYRVCLYVYNSSYCIDSFCNTVTIAGGCHVSAAWTYTVHGDTVFLHSVDTSSANNHYWTFGTGSTYVSGTSVIHVFPNYGVNRICLHVYTPGTTCSDSSCNTITLVSPCNVHAVWQSSTNGDTAHFYAGSNAGTVYYSWHFGDGSSGTGSSPTHVYTQPGTYHVCLYAYSGTSCIDSFCNNITITNPCNISAAWTYTVHGDTVFLHSTDTSAHNNHYWTFGPGTNYASGTSVTHVFPNLGTYQICLHVYTPGTSCSDSSCNYVTVAGTCNVHAVWQSYTIGDTAHFFAGTNTGASYSWNFGDGHSGTGASPTHVYAQPGTYHVCLYASTSVPGCTDSFCNTITIVNPCHVSAAWSYTISGDTVFLHSADTSSANHHIWSFNGVYNTTNQTSLYHVFGGPGTYHICQLVYAPGTACVDSSCNTITIANTCTAIAAWTYTVSGNVVVYHAADTSSSVYLDWNYGDGSYGFGQNETHTYAQPGTYHVCLYAYSSNTCVDSFCNTVTVGSGCHVSAAWTYTIHGDTVYLTASDTSSINHHYWLFDGNTSTYVSGITATHVYTGPGTYHICLYVYTPGTNCTDSSCNTITITNPCNVTAAWQSYMRGDTAHFFAVVNSGTVYYNWNYGDGTTGSGATPTHIYSHPGTYHVCLYAYTGTNCIDSFCNTVTVAGGCHITSLWTYAEYGDSVHFTAADTNSAAHHYWSFGDGTTGSGFDISHVYTAPGTYHVCCYVYIPGSACIDSSCNTVTVSGTCTLTAALNFVHLSNDTVAFYALFQDSNTNFIWIYGDGTSSSGSYSVHGYAVPGTYHVCLQVFIPGTPCRDSVCLDVNIGNSCAVTAAWASITRPNDSIQFYAADPDPNAVHTWAFGDGTGASGSYAAHTFPTAGTYHVCLFVSVPGTTCSDSLCKDVSTALGIEGIGTNYPAISLRPNPFSQYAVMNIDGPAATYEVRIYDMIGQLVRTDIAVKNSIMIDRGHLASGIYTYVVMANSAVIGKGKMSVE